MYTVNRIQKILKITTLGLSVVLLSILFSFINISVAGAQVDNVDRNNTQARERQERQCREAAGKSWDADKQECIADTTRPEDELPMYDKSNNCTESDISSSNCGIVRYLVILINALSALAGIVIIGSIIYAGIQYSMAGGDSQKVSASKDRIRNAIIALILFTFGYAILNYLVPGGVL